MISMLIASATFLYTEFPILSRPLCPWQGGYALWDWSRSCKRYAKRVAFFRPMAPPDLLPENPLLQIGELSRRSDLPIKTLRYYEEIGLIEAVNRTQGGFRLFSPSCLDRLSFIKEAKAIGLSLAEIGQILAIYDRGQPPCPLVEKTLTDKLREIDQRIASLIHLRHRLETLLHSRDQHSPQARAIICPIIQQDLN